MTPFSFADHTWNERRELGRAVFTSIMRQGPIIDKFSTWMLLGEGAICAILVANLDKVHTAMKPGWKWWFTVMFAVSAAAGVWQKITSMRVRIAVELDAKIQEPAAQLLNAIITKMPIPQEIAVQSKEAQQEFALSEMRKVVRALADEMKDSAPPYLRRNIEKWYHRSWADPLARLRRDARLFVRQLECTVVQAAFLIIQIAAVPFLMR